MTINSCATPVCHLLILSQGEWECNDMSGDHETLVYDRDLWYNMPTETSLWSTLTTNNCGGATPSLLPSVCLLWLSICHLLVKWYKQLLIPYTVLQRQEMANNTNPNPTVPLVLSLLACFLFAIGIIVAGYIHGNMHINAVYHSLTAFVWTSHYTKSITFSPHLKNYHHMM